MKFSQVFLIFPPGLIKIFPHEDNQQILTKPLTICVG